MLNDIKVALNLDTSKYDAALGKAQNSTNTFASKLTGLKGNFVAVGAAVAAAAAAIIGKLVSAQMKAIDATSKLARGLGTSVAALQTLQMAADYAGISQNEITSAAEKLQQQLGRLAVTGKGAAEDGLNALGIKLQDIINLPADEKFALIAEKIQESGMSTSETAAALQTLGIRGGEMVAWLQSGAAELTTTTQLMKDFNWALTDTDAQNIERANDAMSIFGKWLNGIAQKIAVELAPLLAVVGEKFADWLSILPDVGGAFDVIADVAAQVFTKIAGGIDIIIGAFQTLSGAFYYAAGALVDAFAPAIDAVIFMFNKIASAWNSTIGGLGIKNDTLGIDVKVPKMGTFDGNASDLAAGLKDRGAASFQEGVGRAVNGLGDIFGMGPNSQKYAEMEAASEEARRLAASAQEANIALNELTEPESSGSGAGKPGKSGGGRSKQIKSLTEETEKATEAAKTWKDVLDEGVMTIQDVATNALTSMTDAFAEFVTTGKMDFKSLIDSMIADLARLASQRFFAEILGTLGGGSGMVGGFIRSMFPTTNWDGGLINSPTKFMNNGQLASAGEKGVEAIMPLQRDSRGRLGVVTSGDSGGGTTVVNVNTTINNSGNKAATSEEEGRKMANTFNRAIEQKIVEVMMKQKQTRRGYA